MDDLSDEVISAQMIDRQTRSSQIHRMGFGQAAKSSQEAAKKQPKAAMKQPKSSQIRSSGSSKAATKSSQTQHGSLIGSRKQPCLFYLFLSSHTFWEWGVVMVVIKMLFGCCSFEWQCLECIELSAECFQVQPRLRMECASAEAGSSADELHVLRCWLDLATVVSSQMKVGMMMTASEFCLRLKWWWMTDVAAWSLSIPCLSDSSCHILHCFTLSYDACMLYQCTVQKLAWLEDMKFHDFWAVRGWSAYERCLQSWSLKVGWGIPFFDTS